MLGVRAIASAGAWSLLYGALCAAWALGMAGLPSGRVVDPDAALSIVGHLPGRGVAAGIAARTPRRYPWPVVNQFIMISGGVAWGIAAVAYRRRVSGACPRCGRSALPSR